MAEREAERRAWRVESISSWLENADARYADALAKFVKGVTSAWALRNHWHAYTDLAKAQAEHKIAKEVEHRIARSAETSAFEPMGACDLRRVASRRPRRPAKPGLQRRVALHRGV